eukprot:CAMPEP_0119106884 /NCGR_PEP_ID=MMETSP1180-20130426/6895_1 /TAXON_ID=3052 ORGANISM="Chlamydomonas cf sp, Strain CCMP681" /NCGR_SAMPLE_ID=MMETSP1180 /ASSEMBLY_ACC=CAM_ASM_000741 /LENGTH=74 /DNA_ID=CAMNT_0007092285 /DNA_START=129 /DNA_END=353 /DNA_ORIENTATION=+
MEHALEQARTLMYKQASGISREDEAELWKRTHQCLNSALSNCQQAITVSKQNEDLLRGQQQAALVQQQRKSQAK